MTHGIGALPKFIPSPPISSFHVGPLDIHFYALGYIIGITMAILITRRRWRALGGDPDLVGDIALWVVPAGIIGGRIYFDITTPGDIPHVWYGVFAVWTGGLGIWGGIALAAAVGAWRLYKLGITVGPFANAIAPALLVAQRRSRPHPPRSDQQRRLRRVLELPPRPLAPAPIPAPSRGNTYSALEWLPQSRRAAPKAFWRKRHIADLSNAVHTVRNGTAAVTMVSHRRSNSWQSPVISP